MKSRMTLALLSAGAVLVAACGTGTGATTTAATDLTTATTAGAAPTTTAGDTGTTAAAAGTTVVVASTELGDIVTDQEGYTLYVFMPDEQGTPTCIASPCSDNWPALGTATAGDGVDAALLGTVEWADGSVQATYNGWPLYYFAGDAAAGDLNGQGVNDIWWVVGADGEPISS
jgi:predicted lipoprotein with Yx(FWY)xxD motif